MTYYRVGLLEATGSDWINAGSYRTEEEARKRFDEMKPRPHTSLKIERVETQVMCWVGDDYDLDKPIEWVQEEAAPGHRFSRQADGRYELTRE